MAKTSPKEYVLLASHWGSDGVKLEKGATISLLPSELSLLVGKIADPSAPVADNTHDAALKAANDELSGQLAKLQTANDDFIDGVAGITPENCWDWYSAGVGGKTFDGKNLPKYKDIGKQQAGWLAIVEGIVTAVSNKDSG